MGESPWYIGKMEGDFINNMICIYNFLANLSPGMANVLLNYKILCLLNTQMKSFHFFKYLLKSKLPKLHIDNLVGVR